MRTMISNLRKSSLQIDKMLAKTSLLIMHARMQISRFDINNDFINGFNTQIIDSLIDFMGVNLFRL